MFIYVSDEMIDRRGFIELSAHGVSDFQVDMNSLTI